MITIFNQKELCITRHLEEQENIRDILQANGIEYKLKMIDRNNYGTEILTKVASTNTENLYKLYVKKEDLERAIFLIKQIKR